MENARPTWLREPCPTWCARDHTEEDHPEDRFHASDASYIPVIAASDDTLPASASAAAIDLVIHVSRRLGELTDWVTIEPAQSRLPRLFLTRESARSLVQGLKEQLGIGTGDQAPELSKSPRRVEESRSQE